MPVAQVHLVLPIGQTLELCRGAGSRWCRACWARSQARDGSRKGSWWAPGLRADPLALAWRAGARRLEPGGGAQPPAWWAEAARWHPVWGRASRNCRGRRPGRGQGRAGLPGERDKGKAKERGGVEVTGKWQGHQLWSWSAHVPTTDSSPAPPPSLLLPSSARTDRQTVFTERPTEAPAS